MDGFFLRRTLLFVIPALSLWFFGWQVALLVFLALVCVITTITGEY